MGCGASALRPEDHDNQPFHYKVVRPIHEEPPKAPPPPLKNDAVFSFQVKAADHEGVGVQELKKGGHAKPPSLAAQSEAHPIGERDDAITGAASPSFREYCYNSRSSSDIDEADMVETTDNMGDDDPTMAGKSKPAMKEIPNPKKEGEKKERKGGKLRDVINKGRAGGKKMGIVRHRSDNRAGRLT